MTLKDLLVERILLQGPLSIAEYMEQCLLHPQYGYYTNQNPIGAEGDFITAPEISQIFGELLGLCLAQGWINQGRPSDISLVEAGPGRGTLMADALRATGKTVSSFNQAADLQFIETSWPLYRYQIDLLKDYDPKWYRHFNKLPPKPLFFVANEFFDSLPINQFKRDGKKWRERKVTVNSGRLVFTFGDASDQPSLSYRMTDTQSGDIIELQNKGQKIIEIIAERIANYGGLALIIDYGHWRSLGDTLQAIRKHHYVHPLFAPGECDLTAHVDFESLAYASVPCKTTMLTTQRIFLERLGISLRMQKLCTNLSKEKKEEVVGAHRRLTDPSECGELFKVLGIFPSDQSPPPGLTV
ncbi:MAG: SAM-dependent methyltransferase [Aestuariivita sp.]|nr:SAM-dependent methyltransferase [Aestuariivita sp.]